LEVSLECDALHGLFRDFKLFIGGDYQYPDLAIFALNFACFIKVPAVLAGIYFYTQVRQAFTGAGANETGILTDSTGKDDGIELAQDGAIGADVFFYAVAIHINGQPGGGVSPVGEFSDFAHVIDAADALEAALPV
jgi:hypothetical protein